MPRTSSETLKNLVREFWKRFSEQRWDDAKELLHPAKFLSTYPQTKERFVGRDRYVGMNAAYPGNHRIEVVQMIGDTQRVACTVFIEAADTGQKTFGTAYFEFEDGYISRMTEFWGAPYVRPAWREKWSVLEDEKCVWN